MTPLHGPKATEGRGQRCIEHSRQEQVVLPGANLIRVQTEVEKKTALMKT